MEFDSACHCVPPAVLRDTGSECRAAPSPIQFRSRCGKAFGAADLAARDLPHERHDTVEMVAQLQRRVSSPGQARGRWA
jgi:hypothetical protein